MQIRRRRSLTIAVESTNNMRPLNVCQTDRLASPEHLGNRAASSQTVCAGWALTALAWLLVFAACSADVHRISAALYLSRCPHGLPLTLSQWGGRILEHVIAFPLSTLAMSALCVGHSLLGRRDGCVEALLRAVVMLLAMPFICELAWVASAGAQNWGRPAGFLASTLALSAGFDAYLCLMTSVIQRFGGRKARRR